MRSIWIALGRDTDFGIHHTVEDFYVFESSFDAHKFVRGVKNYMDIPDKVRNQDWSVEEHPINEKKISALLNFHSTHKEDTNGDN